MKPALLAISLLLAAPVATAAEKAEMIAADSVLSAVGGDFDGDGSVDRAVLVEGTDSETVLYVFLADAGGGARRLALKKAGAAWMGLMAGTQPSLAVNAKGSLLVKSENDSIGRDRWSQTLTLAWRDGAFAVVGFTFASRDTLDPRKAASCDLNLATGRGTRNGKAIAVATKPLPMADWNDDVRPRECGS
jgi:hypothetical protein